MNTFTRTNKTSLFKFLPLIVICSMFYSSISEARLRMFSRANCFPPGGLNIGNESISWDPIGTNYWLWVYSLHYQRGTLRHTLSSGWEHTWWNNSAAHRDHVSQALWFVYGNHYRWSPTTGTRLDKLTSAWNCNASQF